MAWFPAEAQTAKIVAALVKQLARVLCRLETVVDVLIERVCPSDSVRDGSHSFGNTGVQSRGRRRAFRFLQTIQDGFPVRTYAHLHVIQLGSLFCLARDCGRYVKAP